MKVYFSAAIVQKDKFGSYYDRIVKSLKNNGHQVFEDTTKVDLQEALRKDDNERIAYYKQVLKWIAQADVVVLEVSFPSTLHIGHEISLALEKGKPVLALYAKGHEPAFFLGKEDEKLFWTEYTKDNLEEELKSTLEMAYDSADTRFNFFISPSQSAYLDWVAKNKKIPRSVYLRDLIQKDMDKSKEYPAT